MGGGSRPRSRRAAIRTRPWPLAVPVVSSVASVMVRDLFVLQRAILPRLVSAGTVSRGARARPRRPGAKARQAGRGADRSASASATKAPSVPASSASAAAIRSRRGGELVLLALEGRLYLPLPRLEPLLTRFADLRGIARRRPCPPDAQMSRWRGRARGRAGSPPLPAPGASSSRTGRQPPRRSVQPRVRSRAAAARPGDARCLRTRPRSAAPPPSHRARSARQAPRSAASAAPRSLRSRGAARRYDLPVSSSASATAACAARSSSSRRRSTDARCSSEVETSSAASASIRASASAISRF